VVRDTGTGMDAETRKRAFEPFFTTKPVGKGTGLGLAMVFGAVKAHGGAVDVDTAPGKGTTMAVYLPVSAAHEPRAAPGSETKPRPKKGIVLVVDDEPLVREGTVRLVERLGLGAVTARDGEEAIDVYSKRRDEIVLVLLDMVM